MGDPFSERDRLLLSLLRPHLAQVLEDHDLAVNQPPERSPRQRELVTLLAGGLTNRQMGRSLGMAEGTVRKHVRWLPSRTSRPASLSCQPES